jgi:hypothetical protein
LIRLERPNVPSSVPVAAGLAGSVFPSKARDDSAIGRTPDEAKSFTP